MSTALQPAKARTGTAPRPQSTDIPDGVDRSELDRIRSVAAATVPRTRCTEIPTASTVQSSTGPAALQRRPCRGRSARRSRRRRPWRARRDPLRCSGDRAAARKHADPDSVDGAELQLHRSRCISIPGTAGGRVLSRRQYPRLLGVQAAEWNYSCEAAC